MDYGKSNNEVKFANYKYHGRHINNLGDHIQIMTIDYLYMCMGVDKKEIIYIDINDLSTYDGPPVLLPVSLPLVNYSEHGIASMFSKNITPVFFGLTMPKTDLQPDEVEYLKKHEPVGCRDEQALQTMNKYNVDAYLGGCLTVTLPKRKQIDDVTGKIYIVDVPKEFKKFIPKSIAERAVWDTHIYHDYMENPTQVAVNQYKKYWEEASLVITGLLHASVPCMAFGIPVILARDFLSYRFAWLEKLLPIYTKEQYEEIDWNPMPLDIESHKELVKQLFQKRMYGKDATFEISELHKFYMDRDKGTYINDVFIEIQEFIDETWKNHDEFYQYAVWGLTQMAEITVDYISRNYPNAQLTHVYDRQEGLIFRGIKAILPENIVHFPDETVFVTTVSAAESAKQYFESIDKDDTKYKTLRIIR